MKVESEGETVGCPSSSGEFSSCKAKLILIR